MSRSPKSAYRLLSMTKVFGTALLATLLACVLPLSAKDLGVQGRTWKVIEIDMRQLLVGNNADLDPKRLKDELRSATNRFMDSRPKRTMGKVSETKTVWMDPSFVLDQDLQAPVQDAKGEWHWQVRFAKGTRFNPLTVQRPHNGLFFFDGNSEEEVKLAAATRKAFPGRVHLIDAVGANPSKLTKLIGGPVFSMTDAMVARFSISTTPTLLYTGEGLHSLQLGITSFAAPYSVQQIEQAWPSIRIKIPEGSKK